MEKTSTSFIDPVVGEVKIYSEVSEGKFSNVIALEVNTNKETKRYFNGILKFAENKQIASMTNYNGFIKKPTARNIYKAMQEEDGLNNHYN
jgi:hypothetical protein